MLKGVAARFALSLIQNQLFLPRVPFWDGFIMTKLEMTRRTKLSSLIGTASLGLFSPACARNAIGEGTLAGRWGGFLAVGSGLGLILEITVNQPIVLISVDQGNARIVATGGQSGPRIVDLEFASIGGQLKLVLTSQGTLEGQFTQGRSTPITFTRLARGQNPSRPSPAPYQDLQTEVDAARAKSGVPALGGAFLLAKSGSMLSREAVSGVLVQGEQARVSAGMRWHVGSITKSMTATLVARLVERGLLAWDMKLGDVLSDLAPNMLPAYRSVTLSQLMTGRSGMPTNISIPNLILHLATDETPTQRRKIWVQQALSLEPTGAVGTSFIYPNNGYVIAGALCEKVTGTAYESLMAEEVFRPLGLTTAGFGPPPIGNPQGHRKAIMGGRSMAVGVGNSADNPAAMSPAGRVHMSLSDLVKFGFAHCAGHQGKRNTYLQQTTWQFLHSPPAGTSGGIDYAYGWIARPDGTLWHNGSNTSWLAELAFDPAKNVSACSCATLFDSEAATSRILAAGLAQAG